MNIDKMNWNISNFQFCYYFWKESNIIKQYKYCSPKIRPWIQDILYFILLFHISSSILLKTSKKNYFPGSLIKVFVTSWLAPYFWLCSENKATQICLIFSLTSDLYLANIHLITIIFLTDKILNWLNKIQEKGLWPKHISFNVETCEFTKSVIPT